MCFRRLLCVGIEMDQLKFVNCWVIIHCLEVSCKEDQIMSAATARANLFLKYEGQSKITESWVHISYVG